MVVGGLKRIAVRSFRGDSRRGPRHAYIIKELKKRGCHPYVDKYGNIWVEKGKGSRTTIFSSHIDIDPSIRKVAFTIRKRGNRRVFNGVLDNAIGCYINLLLAQRGPRRGKAIYVFTASEEHARSKPRSFARSAREIVKELKRRRIKPSLCVAIDVTYPKLLKHPDRVDWSQDYRKLFDLNDPTHCYLDGYSRPLAKKLGVTLVRRFRDRKVGIRELSGHDEAHIYSRISPSFAFGPVVYGSFDRPRQEMPFAHLRTAVRFLRNV